MWKNWVHYSIRIFTTTIKIIYTRGGYYGSIKNWELLQNAAKEYSGDFSNKPHTSIIYSNDKSLLIPINMENDITIIGNMKVVNINGADPLKWSLLN